MAIMRHMRRIIDSAVSLARQTSCHNCRSNQSYFFHGSAHNFLDRVNLPTAKINKILVSASNSTSNSSAVVPNCSRSLFGQESTKNVIQAVLPVLCSTNSRSVVTSQKVVEVSGRMDEPKLLSKDEREEFMSLFPELLRDLVEQPELRDMEETNRWLARLLQYNVPHGKRNRGLATALAYRYMANELTEENVRLSYVLGWCLEILQAFFLVADDIMDGSETRRGRPCWYKVEDLGPAAFNDSIMLECTIYSILKKHFRDKDYYVDLLEILHDVTYKTSYGQSLDTRTGLERKMDTYTMDRYSAIVKYKTSFYSFNAPVSLAMAMAGINDPDLIRQVRTVTLEMGHLFQVQDDYLDCFGDVEVTGKIGTDIQDCKCSWLFIIAMQSATPEQQEYLKENYGKNDQAKIDRVKKLYIDLGIPEKYNMYEEKTYKMICTHIQQMSPSLPKQLFLNMLDKIYGRTS